MGMKPLHRASLYDFSVGYLQTRKSDNSLEGESVTCDHIRGRSLWTILAFAASP